VILAAALILYLLQLPPLQQHRMNLIRVETFQVCFYFFKVMHTKETLIFDEYYDKAI